MNLYTEKNKNELLSKATVIHWFVLPSVILLSMCLVKYDASCVITYQT